jgi:hypothetical protein
MAISVSSGYKNAFAFHVDINFPEISQCNQGIHTPVHHSAPDKDCEPDLVKGDGSAQAAGQGFTKDNRRTSRWVGPTDPV